MRLLQHLRPLLHSSMRSSLRSSLRRLVCVLPALGAASVGIAACLIVPRVAAAQSIADAQSFVAALFQAYRTGSDGPDYLGAHASDVFAPPLLAMIETDQKRTSSDARTLRMDPICGCHDASYLSHVQVKVVDTDPTHAIAVVSYRFPNAREQASFDLESVDGAWRISDIHRRKVPSLVQVLQNATH